MLSKKIGMLFTFLDSALLPQLLNGLYEEGGDGMKCDKCFFCTHIGKGIYADYPVKYCKVTRQYFMPFVMENGEKRKLDFSDMNDLKTWHGTGCNIHPKTVEKAKQDFLKSLEKAVMEGET